MTNDQDWTDISAEPSKEQVWRLRLYVAGQTPKCVQAFANLKRICEEHLAGQYRIEVIDLIKSPQLAEGDQILAIPTLVRKLPEPVKRIIGDLSNTERVLVGLDLRAVVSAQGRSACAEDRNPPLITAAGTVPRAPPCQASSTPNRPRPPDDASGICAWYSPTRRRGPSTR